MQNINTRGNITTHLSLLSRGQDTPCRAKKIRHYVKALCGLNSLIIRDSQNLDKSRQTEPKPQHLEEVSILM